MTEGQVINTADVHIVYPTYDISVMQESENLVFLLKQVIARYISDVILSFDIYYRFRQGALTKYSVTLPSGDYEKQINLPLFMIATEYHYEIVGSDATNFELIEADLKHFLIPKGLR